MVGATSNWIAPGAVTSGGGCPPCIINIPDAAFKAALVANNLIDTN
ncbi:MAG: hypothetical protein V9E88_09335 [Ferruginibacter sp.]